MSLFGMLAAGCTAATGDDEAIGASHGQIDFSAEEIGAVLALVNDSGTDLLKLDEAVQLDSRAAQNIIAYRNGKNGKHLDGDDNRIDTLEELDAIKYVGDQALSTLRLYANENPLPPVAHVEGVTFDGTQQEAVLWGVNHASLEELDVQVLLDIRAAQNIYNYAPHTSLSAVAKLGFVGEFALSQLRFNADRWRQEMEGAASLAGTFDGVTFDADVAAVALELANEEPWNGLVEAGLWQTGAERIVEGRPYAGLDEVAAVPGVGETTMDQLHYFAFNLANAPE